MTGAPQRGLLSSETDGYDLNGNTTSVTINGGTYRDTYDDEDRLVSVSPPGYISPLDTYVYNGLGLRVGKTDSTGTYAYVCDGTTPGAPVLIDGHTQYTPGLSENRGAGSVYYDFDRLGNRGLGRLHQGPGVGGGLVVAAHGRDDLAQDGFGVFMGHLAGARRRMAAAAELAHQGADVGAGRFV